MSPQSLSSFSTRCYRHLLICKNDEVKLCRMRMTDHPRSRSWCCLRPRRHSKDSGSEETGSLGSEAAPRRDEHFGSQCLAEIRCFLMSRSRQARRDSKNALSTSKFCRCPTRSPNFPPRQNAPEELLTLHVQVLPLCCCLQCFNGAL